MEVKSGFASNQLNTKCLVRIERWWWFAVKERTIAEITYTKINIEISGCS